MHSDDRKIEVGASYLDDGVHLIQDGDLCYAMERKSPSVWAWVSCHHDGATPPEGYFFLRDVFYNKVLIKELLYHSAIELGEPVRLPNGRLARTARLRNG